ncbi:hypothetical protein, conserved [Plasmodium gonderi]|uniref:Uncharacterized protein n=1 Tax=Plasmodium gonderi TaxID=77519 RepID=A0A1Y1JA11_PLAGO|nr:hypothetical protein, conserved [Plasmodium gonderi]GAW79351.1 hypothetical protein, conserved [Plasmodium gonderi]
MNFFFPANKTNQTVNLESVQDDKVTINIYLDEAYTHSGDVFKASFELIGPMKHIGNIKIDYVVLYLYGLYIFNEEAITVCATSQIVEKQENINLPFYGTDQTNEQKYLLFYSNPIILCTDMNFTKSNETFYYHLNCIFPPFLPPSYSGKNIKFKYCMYVQAVKRLYINRTQFVTKKYEHHVPLHLLSSKYTNSPVLDFSLYPIKPHNPRNPHLERNKTSQRDTAYEYLYHNFHVTLYESSSSGSSGSSGPRKQNEERQNENPSSRHALEKRTFNASHIPSYLYNNVNKSRLDSLVCIYNIACQRREDSSLFMLNYILYNYSYFYFLHLFLYLAHHYDYYTNELVPSVGDAKNVGSFNAFLHVLLACYRDQLVESTASRGALTTTPSEQSSYVPVLPLFASHIGDAHKGLEPTTNQKKETGKNSNKKIYHQYATQGEKSADQSGEMMGEKSANESGEMTGEKSANESGEKLGEKSSDQSGEMTGEKSADQSGEMTGEKSADQSGEMTSEKSANESGEKDAHVDHEELLKELYTHEGDVHFDGLVDQFFLKSDDKDLQNFYLSNYNNFVFNDMKYEPIRWYDNLVLGKSPNVHNASPDEEDVLNIYLETTDSASTSDVCDEEDNVPNSETKNEYLSRPLNKEDHVVQMSKGGVMDLTQGNTKDKLGKITKMDIMQSADLSEEKVNNSTATNNQLFPFDEMYAKADTIIKCMHERNLFRRMYKRKIKPHCASYCISPYMTHDTSDTLVSEWDEEKEKMAITNGTSKNVYRINSNGKSICFITLTDGVNNKIKNSFSYGSTVNVNFDFRRAEIYTVHVDVYLKRVEKLKVNTNYLILNKNKIYDENDIINEGYSSVDSNETSYHLISNYKLVAQQSISTMQCSLKNVAFVLNEEIIPAFRNNIVKIDYLIDFNFFCLPKGMEAHHNSYFRFLSHKEFFNGDNVNDNNNNDESDDGNMCNFTFRIPLHITERTHDFYPNDANTNLAYQQKLNPQCSRNQLLLHNSHKFMYTDRRYFVRTLKI